MKRSIAGALLTAGSLTLFTALAAADDSKEEAIKKDFKLIEGTWKAVALTVNGNESTKDDAGKLSVVNGPNGAWSVRSEGREISKGISTFDPTKQPKTIDLTMTEGEGIGNKYLGIYELGDKTRKLCFVPAGKTRPAEFKSTPGSDAILVVFERQKEE